MMCSAPSERRLGVMPRASRSRGAAWGASPSPLNWSAPGKPPRVPPTTCRFELEHRKNDTDHDRGSSLNRKTVLTVLRTQALAATRERLHTSRDQSDGA